MKWRLIVMFRRKIYDSLVAWKKNDAQSCALLINGARRVGKSFIVEQFAKAEYRSYLMIDFSKADDGLKELFTKMIGKLKRVLSRRLSVPFGRCSRCGSRSVKKEMVLESGFVSRLVPKWTCRKCGHSWGGSRLPPGAVG